MTYPKVTFVFILKCAICLTCLYGIPAGNCTQNDLLEYSIQTSQPLPRPVALSMIMEDSNDDGEELFPESEAIVQTTTDKAKNTELLTTVEPTNETIQPKGRAINFSIRDHDEGNILNKTTSKHDDLSDVSMDNDDLMEMVTMASTAKTTQTHTSSTRSFCVDAGLTYENGETLENGCNSICTCTNGKMECKDRCSEPFFRKGKKIEDPLCSAQDVEDPCCSILVCSSTSAAPATKVSESCTYKNKTYHKNERIEDGCNSICTCEANGQVVCTPRCIPIHKTSERCVEVPDPLDSCCKKVLCDVTINDHEPEKEHDDQLPKLLTARYANATTIKIEFDGDFESEELPEVEVSENKMIWINAKLSPGGYLQNLEPYVQFVKVKGGDDVIKIHNVPPPPQGNQNEKQCTYKDQVLKIGEEFNDNCTSLCVCRESGLTCLKIECPTYFGVDVLNPNCIDWETVPKNFVPTPPNCCPEKVKCKTTGSCVYKNETYGNWQQIPINVTGCEQRCYCEMGKVECQNICPPVAALPPDSLGCPAHRTALDHLPDDDCCLYWTCKDDEDSKGNLLNKMKESNKNNENMEINTVMPFVDPLVVKQPSKILGPLVVYTNKETDTKEKAVSYDIPELNKLPNITLDENHYYMSKGDMNHNVKPVKHNQQSSNVIKPAHKATENKKPESNLPPFLGPLSPTHYSPFPSANPQPKPTPNKPPPPPPPQYANQEQFHIPLQYPHNPNHPQAVNNPHNDPMNSNRHQGVNNNQHIEIHGKGDPDELLQFINQHPEIANYPSGSVLEIQNVGSHQPHPPKNYNTPQRVNPNMLAPTHNKQIVPYLIENRPPDDLASQLNVEHILQHIHKNAGQPFLPFPPNAQIPINNGQLVFTAPNGLIIPTRHQPNLTQGMNGGLYPGGFYPPDFHNNADEIVVHGLEAIDAHTIRLAFIVPRVLVGLHGRVEVRYTYKDNNDPNTWQVQIFAPPNDLIETPQLEFDLLGLKEDTEYKIKIAISLRDLHNTPSSRIYTVRTLKESALTTLPPMIPIEPNLVVTDINATWLNIAWRKFTENELQFIDGVQIRYREIDGKIYAATPLIHRAVTGYTLENLKPNTKYEAGIFFIPFPGQPTELHAEHMIHFTTANEIDSYGFNVTLEISQVKATSVEIAWAGVPYPEDKYVNIYRAIYQSDSGKGDSNTFKIAKRDSPPKALIMDLKPGIRYRLWLEVYLTNGRIKTSNVQDFVTKPRSVPSLGASTQQGKLEAGDLSEHKGDYYGPLVIVAILAAISILSTLILLLILVKRHSQNKATITPPPRVSQSAYDNPSYKVEIQQETMNL